MSPKVGTTVDVSTWAQPRTMPPERLIRLAISRVRAQGIVVAAGDLGVEHAGSDGWRLYCRPRQTVDAAGAVLLAFQPPAEDDAEPHAVAARALGVGMAWLDGVLDGHSRDVSVHWLSSLQKSIFLNGLEVGFQLAREVKP